MEGVVSGLDGGVWEGLVGVDGMGVGVWKGNDGKRNIVGIRSGGGVLWRTRIEGSMKGRVGVVGVGDVDGNGSGDVLVHDEDGKYCVLFLKTESVRKGEIGGWKGLLGEFGFVQGGVVGLDGSRGVGVVGKGWEDGKVVLRVFVGRVREDGTVRGRGWFGKGDIEGVRRIGEGGIVGDGMEWFERIVRVGQSAEGREVVMMTGHGVMRLVEVDGDGMVRSFSSYTFDGEYKKSLQSIGDVFGDGMARALVTSAKDDDEGEHKESNLEILEFNLAIGPKR